MILTKSFESPEELAKFAIGRAAVFLVVGSRSECDAMLEEVQSLMRDDEELVHLEQSARIFGTMEKPPQVPAVAAWSSKGILIGYREPDESLAEFIGYARGYC